MGQKTTQCCQSSPQPSRDCAPDHTTASDYVTRASMIPSGPPELKVQTQGEWPSNLLFGGNSTGASQAPADLKDTSKQINRLSSSVVLPPSVVLLPLPHFTVLFSEVHHTQPTKEEKPLDLQQKWSAFCIDTSEKGTIVPLSEGPGMVVPVNPFSYQICEQGSSVGNMDLGGSQQSYQLLPTFSLQIMWYFVAGIIPLKFYTHFCKLGVIPIYELCF